MYIYVGGLCLISDEVWVGAVRCGARGSAADAREAICRAAASPPRQQLLTAGSSFGGRRQIAAEVGTRGTGDARSSETQDIASGQSVRAEVRSMWARHRK